jgi:FkbM family methyltransferase
VNIDEIGWRLSGRAIRRIPPAAGQMRFARRALPRLSPVADPVRLRLGPETSLELQVSDRLQAELFLTGAWEPRMQQFLVDRVPPGGTFFDVGANVGLASLSLATRLYRQGVQVHAFEPSEANRAAFERNLSLNPHLKPSVRLNPVAVGATQGELALRLGAESGHHHVVTSGTHEDAPVPVVTLAEYAREQGLSHIDCLKMDVEGWELEALRGAEELLRAHRVGALVCEIEDSHLRRAGASAGEVVAFLLECGYVPIPLERFSQRLRGALSGKLEPGPLAGDVAFLPVEELTTAGG